MRAPKMPFASIAKTKGITLPPKGWVLFLLLIVYLFSGLVWHDPWKNSDVISIGVVWNMLQDGKWFALQLAGNTFVDAPFYYWIAAIIGKVSSLFLPTHGAIRLASGAFALIALASILLAARALNGRDFAAAAPLLLAGSVGFIFHAHEAQPMLAVLAFHAATYFSLTLFEKHPKHAAFALISALLFTFLAGGALALALLLPIIAWAILFLPIPKTAHIKLGCAIGAALFLSALYLCALRYFSPTYFSAFWAHEMGKLTPVVQPLQNAFEYLNMLPWYAWPALPLAFWSIWVMRRNLSNKEIAFPLAAFLSTFILISFSLEAGSAQALFLLPSLVLLAVPGIAKLRRGAANGFDWFAMMIFSLLAVLVWIGWFAIIFGVPARLAQRALILEPGFVGQFDFLPVLFSLVLSGVWVWLILTSPRSPLRSLFHWMSGVTLFWCLLAFLWMPWIDYGKSYRVIAGELKQALPKLPTCIASAGVSPAVQASLDYFSGIRTQPLGDANRSECRLLLIHGQIQNMPELSSAGFRQIWEGKRKSDRRTQDKLHLFLRGNKNKSLPELEIDEPILGDR